jgi:hypothetical protein
MKHKALIVAATAVVLVGGSALAYKAYARYDGWGHGRYHSRMNADDMGAFADARIAALKAGLRLSAEQEKLWPQVESTLKNLSAKHIAHRNERRAQRGERADRDERSERPSPIERLRKGADRMSEIGADLKQLADATEPLYQSLDESQKRRFDALAHAGMRGMGGMGGMNHRDERRGWRRHGEFDGGRRHMEGHGGQHMEDRGEMRRRIEWTPAIPQGAERL